MQLEFQGATLESIRYFKMVVDFSIYYNTPYFIWRRNIKGAEV